jgi:Ca-activated chloride channel family protein
VIGVGVDFNTDLIESITKNRGANYHSVHSPAQFIEQMDENFDFMVTPLVFDLRLALEGEGWSIDRVFGSPEADEATGEVFRVNTLFPSRTQDGQTRGGLVLVKLSRNPEVENRELKIAASFENRLGEAFSVETRVEFVESSEQHFDNTGIRKGILLTRYASLIRNWILDERSSYHDERPILRPLIDSEWGIPILPPWPISRLGQWERRSTPLYVAHKYREIFSQFRAYFVSESEALGDEDLQQELKILDRLANNPDLIVAE